MWVLRPLRHGSHHQQSVHPESLFQRFVGPAADLEVVPEAGSPAASPARQQPEPQEAPKRKRLAKRSMQQQAPDANAADMDADLADF